MPPNGLELTCGAVSMRAQFAHDTELLLIENRTAKLLTASTRERVQPRRQVERFVSCHRKSLIAKAFTFVTFATAKRGGMQILLDLFT